MDLDTTDKYLLTASTLGLFGDYAQTRQISQMDDRHETNPALGRNPTTAEINRYFGAILIMNTALTKAPKMYRKFAWASIAATQITSITQNSSIGIGFKF